VTASNGPDNRHLQHRNGLNAWSYYFSQDSAMSRNLRKTPKKAMSRCAFSRKRKDGRGQTAPGWHQ